MHSNVGNRVQRGVDINRWEWLRAPSVAPAFIS